MKSAIVVAFAVVTAAGAARADAAVRNAAADEKAVAKIGVDWTDAWNRHDAGALAAIFVESGDMMNPMGRMAKGHQQVLKLLQDEHGGALKSTKMTQSCEPARFLDANVAQLDCEFTLEGIAAEPALRGHVTDVVVLEGGRWGIASLRAMVPRQVGTPAVAAASPGR
jgi:uncharacterized protein (TIGR02246 family)